jgi:predicted transcriptional regulator
MRIINDKLGVRNYKKYGVGYKIQYYKYSKFYSKIKNKVSNKHIINIPMINYFKRRISFK